MALEVPLPGVGALYVGRIAQGVIWLVGTIAGLVIALLVAGHSIVQLVPTCASTGGLFGAACAPYTEGAAQPLVWVAALALLWLNIRLALLTVQVPARTTGLRARSRRVTLIGLALALSAGGLWLGYDWLGVASFYAGYPQLLQRDFMLDRLAVEFARNTLGALFVAVGAWLVSLRGLGRAVWWQVAIEVAAGTLAVWAALFGAQYLILATSGLGQATVGELLSNQLAFMSAYAPRLLLAAALGLSFAGWAAPWRALRGSRSGPPAPGGALLFSLGTLALVITLALVPVAIHALPTAYDIINDTSRDRLWSVVGSAALLALAVLGAPVAARPWRRG